MKFKKGEKVIYTPNYFYLKNRSFSTVCTEVFSDQLVEISITPEMFEYLRYYSEIEMRIKKTLTHTKYLSRTNGLTEAIMHAQKVSTEEEKNNFNDWEVRPVWSGFRLKNGLEEAIEAALVIIENINEIEE